MPVAYDINFSAHPFIAERSRPEGPGGTPIPIEIEIQLTSIEIQLTFSQFHMGDPFYCHLTAVKTRYPLNNVT